MHVYSNALLLIPKNGPSEIIEKISANIGKQAHGYVDPVDFCNGIALANLPKKATVSSATTEILGEPIVYPFLFAAKFTYKDERSFGRIWVTEYGILQKELGGPILFTITVKTDEISTQISKPPIPIRPKIVKYLARDCNAISRSPANTTPYLVIPGLKVKNLNAQGLQGFLHELDSPSREYPLVLISPTIDGEYLIDPEHLCSVLVGLADVVTIAPEEDRALLGQVLGNDRNVYNGAINLIARTSDRKAYWNRKYHPNQIEQMQCEGASLEDELLSIICHRRNIPLSRRHISIEKVNEVSRSRRVKFAIAKFKGDKDVSDILLADFDAMERDNHKLREENEDLKNMFKSRIHKQASDQNKMLSKSIYGAICGPNSLENTLRLFSILYPTRLHILESAFKSAIESDKAKFELAPKAFDLLFKLAETYWESMVSGNSDIQSGEVFGKNKFAPKENDLCDEGRKQRTFSFGGKEYFMERHLKIVGGFSNAISLRIHFAWIPEEKLILIGHCGQHLKL